jgi:hypothetical protein
MDTTQNRAIQTLIFLADQHSDDTGEITLPADWQDKVGGKAVLLDRRGDADCIRVVTQEEAIEFGNRARAVERELMPGRDG